MKKILPVFILTLLFEFSGIAQSQYEKFAERPGEITMKGIISEDVLLNEPGFTWYQENLKGYNPNALAVGELRKNRDSVQFMAFIGTWCEDSHFVIPKFFSLLEASGYPKTSVTLIGVDRDKKTLSHLTEALNVINVPTIIVFKNGKELGRVVEYGKYGLFDKELGEILAATN